jgi:hypothetical protein
MPCSGGYPPDNYEVISGFVSQADKLNERVSFYKGEANKLTDMLCRLMTILDDKGKNIALPEDIIDWWADHQRFDKEKSK